MNTLKNKDDYKCIRKWIHRSWCYCFWSLSDLPARASAQPTCPLGLISSTSWDLWSPFSKESSLCFYPCSFFSSRVIITRQQGGEPAPHSRLIDLAMDTDNIKKSLITENEMTKLWTVCSSCAVYGYSLIQRLVSRVTPTCPAVYSRQERSEDIYIHLSLSVVFVFNAERVYTAFSSESE